MVDTSFMHMIYDTVVSSPFDLLLFAFGVVGYIVLSQASQGYKKEAKAVGSEVNVTSNTSRVVNTNPCADTASTDLSQALEFMESCNTDSLVAAEINSFLDKHPTHGFTLPEVQKILAFCRSTLTDKAVADRLFECMKSTEEWHVLSTFIRFYLDDGQSEKACDVFELNYATFFDMELDEQMEWQLLMAALKCERQPVAEHLLATSQADIEKHVLLIQQRFRQASARRSDARAANMGDVLSRLSDMFNERYPFEEHSDAESTCFLGDDSDQESDNEDSDWENEQL